MIRGLYRLVLITVAATLQLGFLPTSARGQAPGNFLFGQVMTQTGGPQAGFLSFRLNCPPAGNCPNNVAVNINTLLNSDGTVPTGIVLPSNDLIQPAGSYYEMDLFSTTHQLLAYSYVLVRNCPMGHASCPVFLNSLVLYNPPNPLYTLFSWPTSVPTDYTYNPTVNGSMGWKTFYLKTRPSILTQRAP